MPSVISQPNKITGSVALVFSVLALLLVLSVNATECASASSGSCPVGNIETFASGISINTDLSTNDTVISGDTAASLFFSDSSTDRIGIGLNTPSQLLDVAGNVAITNSGTLTASNGGSLTGTWLDLGSVTTVDINGGTINGITDLAVADGGTGVGTLAAGGVLFGNTAGPIGATSVGTATHVLTSNGAGVDPTFQAIPAPAGGGVDIWDWWRLTANYSNPSGTQVIGSNLERVDTNGFSVLGAGMSQAGGEWVFPATGYWWVSYQWMGDTYGVGNSSSNPKIVYTDDHWGTHSTVTEAYLALDDGMSETGVISAMFHITDVTQQEIRFTSNVASGTGSTYGGSNHSVTAFQFVRWAE